MKENDNFERAIIDAATFENMTKLYIETAKEQLIIDMLIKNIKEMVTIQNPF